MNNVKTLRPEAALRAIEQARAQSSTGNGDPPDNAGMEARVIKLEGFAQDTRDRLTRIETKLDATATKADLMEAVNGQIKWMIVTAVGLGVAAITVMTFVLNNASPKSAMQAQPPIIINVPAAQPTSPTAPPPAK